MKPWQKHIPLQNYTTLQVGGPAEYFVAVETEAELVAAVTEAKQKGIPFRVIGGGSNILVPDNGLTGLIIKINLHEQQVETDGSNVRFTVGAGAIFDDVVAETVTRGYWGLENLSHIPGSVGATPVQNVGAYGVEVADRISMVRVYDTEANAFVALNAEECQFAYRDSLFKTPAGKRYVITAVTFELSTDPQPCLTYKDLATRFPAESEAPQLAEIREAVIEIRSKKFPDWHTVGTAGSFFKNPFITAEHLERLRTTYPDMPGYPAVDGQVKIPLGWILDQVCQLRGIVEGSVGTYEGQALVLINTGDATAADIVAFAEGIAQKVFDATEIVIEWEVTKLS